MHKTLTPSTKLLLAALTLALIGSLAVLSAATARTCYGTYYEYYDGPNHNEIVGAKVACPGYPDQIDYDENGNHTETPWYITETVVCPCGGGGGGGDDGNGGCETEDEDC